MTVKRQITVVCDECGIEFYSGRLYVKDARREASMRRWITVRVSTGHGQKPKDICPKHFTSV